MEECLQALTKNPESTMDEILVNQVRLQSIADKVIQYTRFESGLDDGGSGKAPPAFYYKAFQSQVNEIKNNLPPAFLTDRECINFCIYEDSNDEQKRY